MMLAHFSRVVCRPAAVVSSAGMSLASIERPLTVAPLSLLPPVVPTTQFAAPRTVPALYALCDGDLALHQWVVHQFGAKDCVAPILQHHNITMEELSAQSAADRRILILDALIRCGGQRSRHTGGNARPTIMRKRRLLLRLHRFKKTSFARQYHRRQPNDLKIETDAQIQDNNDYEVITMPVYEALVCRGRELLQALRQHSVPQKHTHGC